MGSSSHPGQAEAGDVPEVETAPPPPTPHAAPPSGNNKKSHAGHLAQREKAPPLPVPEVAAPSDDVAAWTYLRGASCACSCGPAIPMSRGRNVVLILLSCVALLAVALSVYWLLMLLVQKLMAA